MTEEEQVQERDIIEIYNASWDAFLEAYHKLLKEKQSLERKIRKLEKNVKS